MKRIIFIICVLFSMNFYFINIQAEIIESPLVNQQSFDLIEGKKFNIIKGYETSEDLMKSYFYECYYNDIEGHLINGEMIINGSITSDLGIKEIKSIFYATESKLYKYQVLLENEIIYEFIIEDDKPIITTAIEVDLYKEIGYTENNFELSFSKEVDYSMHAEYEVYDSNNDMYISIPLDEVSVEELGFKSLYGMIYKRNTSYENNEVHFVTETSDLLSMEEIKASLKIIDETEQTANFEILNNTYIIKNNYIEPGSYSFTIKAKDTSGNITIQDCFVDVYDLTPPEIIAENKEVSYTLKMSEEEILDLFKITDLASVNVEIIENTYSINYNIPGLYEIKIIATDCYNNFSQSTIEIKVIDDKAPVITINSNLEITTLDNYSLEDFKDFIYVYDICDKEITEYILEDSDNYLLNTKSKGSYSFLIKAKDSSNNKVEASFSVDVLDKDYPIIYADEYTLILSKDYQITKEEILEILQNQGQIKTQEAIIESNYFEQSNPSGNYDLSVIDTEGNFFNNQIEIIEQKEFDYTKIENINEESNTKYYWVIGIVLSIFVISIGGLMFIKFKKSH